MGDGEGACGGRAGPTPRGGRGGGEPGGADRAGPGRPSAHTPVVSVPISPAGASNAQAAGEPRADQVGPQPNVPSHHPPHTPAAHEAHAVHVMVLVAVAIGTGWTYSLVVTLTGGGEVFYEAATVLAAFVLLGHWFEMRARGGANDAIRSLLELAPEKALVLRDGEPVEVPTAHASRTSGPARRRRHVVRGAVLVRAVDVRAGPG
ncbi:Cation transport ATPase-like protein [Parafrankia sp. EAN1pec]|nr:Cation transport ATPase-like protein [Frankia sp. EAN1pec]